MLSTTPTTSTPYTTTALLFPPPPPELAALFLAYLSYTLATQDAASAAPYTIPSSPTITTPVTTTPEAAFTMTITVSTTDTATTLMTPDSIEETHAATPMISVTHLVSSSSLPSSPDNSWVNDENDLTFLQESVVVFEDGAVDLVGAIASLKEATRTFVDDEDEDNHTSVVKSSKIQRTLYTIDEEEENGSDGLSTIAIAAETGQAATDAQQTLATIPTIFTYEAAPTITQPASVLTATNIRDLRVIPATTQRFAVNLMTHPLIREAMMLEVKEAKPKYIEAAASATTTQNEVSHGVIPETEADVFVHADGKNEGEYEKPQEQDPRERLGMLEDIKYHENNSTVVAEGDGSQRKQKALVPTPTWNQDTPLSVQRFFEFAVRSVNGDMTPGSKGVDEMTWNTEKVDLEKEYWDCKKKNRELYTLERAALGHEALRQPDGERGGASTPERPNNTPNSARHLIEREFKRHARMDRDLATCTGFDCFLKTISAFY